VIGEPPLVTGAVHEIVAVVLPATTERSTGALGTLAGVTGEEVAEGGLMPTALTAMTLKTYAVPFVRPVATYEVRIDTGLTIRVQVVPPLIERLTM
jgi:hypothetical protein